MFNWVLIKTFQSDEKEYNPINYGLATVDEYIYTHTCILIHEVVYIVLQYNAI